MSGKDTGSVQSLSVGNGTPYAGTLGKKHPVYDIHLTTTNGGRFVRSFRFNVFRNFHQLLGQSFYRITSEFPESSVRSTLSTLPEAQIEDRRKALEDWLKEVLAKRNELPTNLQKEFANFLQVDENQLYPKKVESKPVTTSEKKEEKKR